MKKILFLALTMISLNATEYFTKLEPYEKHTISAEVNGKVTYVNKTKEYNLLTKNTLVLKLDTKDEQIQLDTLKSSLALQEDIVKIKEQNYKNKQKVKQLSIYDKNQEKLNLIEAKQNLENIKRDIKTQKRNIDKKEFFVSNLYMDEILVSKGEYVTTGTNLYNLYDFSKLKLELFVRVKEIDDLKDKKILIDGKEDGFKIEKISQVRDEKRVSTYKVILSKINTQKDIHFGKIIKVEFK